MMNKATCLAEYVAQHTMRGECRCGLCIDRGERPDPEGHTIDMIFFPVALRAVPGFPAQREEFLRLTKEQKGEYQTCDPMDGNEHGFIELGAWIGDQGLALRYMALGTLLGVFTLLTPRTVLKELCPEEMVMPMAQQGMVTVITKKEM